MKFQMPKLKRSQKQVMSNKRYDEDQLELARSLYLEFKSPREIATKTGIKYRTVLYHAKNNWKEDRDVLRHEILKEISENKKAILSSLTSNSLECVDKAIATLKRRENPPTIAEARMLTNIIAEIDKILRLDEGNPTDIIAEHKPATIIELKEKLKKDPFYIEDASFKEVEDDK